MTILLIIAGIVFGLPVAGFLAVLVLMGVIVPWLSRGLL